MSERRERPLTLPDHRHDRVSTDTRYFAVPGRVQLEGGASLPSVTVAYRTWGDPGNADRRAILVCHGLTDSADADDWWPGIIGPGAAFDPERDFIVCSNVLGSCHGTTGPASPCPDGAQRYRAGFPRVSVRDMVEVQRRLIDHLGIAELELVIGASLGGMQALTWATRYPECVRSLAAIGVGGAQSALGIAIGEAQRAAIRTDPAWRGGYYDDDATPVDGLAAACMIGECGRRSWDSFNSRFGRERGDGGDYQVSAWLRLRGAGLARGFDAVSFVRLTQAMDAWDLGRGRGHYLDVLERIEQPALIIGSSSDILHPPREQELLARHLPNATHESLDSEYGHDAYLVRVGDVSRAIRRFRENGAAPAHVQSGHTGGFSAVRTAAR